MVRWLQAGVVATGFGIALAAAPAVAWADDSATATSGTPSQSSDRTGATHRSTAQRSTRDAEIRPAAGIRKATAGMVRASVIGSKAPAAGVARSSAGPSALLTTQPKVTASGTASAAPGMGFVTAKIRLDIEDVFSGTGRPVVTNPTLVVNGLFQEILRRDPTATERDNYLRRLNMGGVNAVIAGLYTSQEFRQNAVTSYYVNVLGRLPDATELQRGVAKYVQSPASFVASPMLAGGNAAYAYSASGGGPFGAQPTATSYVNLLYRSLLGQSTDVAAESLITKIEGGLSIGRAANQFVQSDAYREVKVTQIFSVLGLAPSQTEVDSYVSNWIRSGGLAGISQSLLATQTNVQRIEGGLVSFPDMDSADRLQEIMLLKYGETTSPVDGDPPRQTFVEQLKLELQDFGDSAAGQQYGCKGTVNTSKCNVAFYTLMSTGGSTRGIPNNALQTSTGFVQVSTLIPTQNNVDMNQSLVYPLRDPTTTELYLGGGPIVAPGGVILTADNGAYVIDGHHRWSALYVMNPYTSIASIDLGYVPTPQAALKETQLAIGAREGYLPWKAAEGPNLFSVDEATFKDQVYHYIWDEQLDTAPTGLQTRQDDTDQLLPNGRPNPGYLRPEVFNEFRDFLTDSVAIPNVDQGALTEEQQLQYTVPIQDYLWGNVLRMRRYNQFIPGATPRLDMPQPLDNAYPPLLQLLDTGLVIYTLPAVSSLG